jgi:hypothetical protein
MVSGMTGHHDEREPDDDDELFLAVGHAVAAGASLEWAIVELHAALLHSPRALLAVAGEGVDRARTGCLDMATLIGPLVEDLVRDALAPVKELWSQRNVLVHSVWMAGSHLGDPARSGITIRLRRTGISTDGWSVESISALTDELGRCAARLSELERRLQDDVELMNLLDPQPSPFNIGSPKIW